MELQKKDRTRRIVLPLPEKTHDKLVELKGLSGVPVCELIRQMIHAQIDDLIRQEREG